MCSGSYAGSYLRRIDFVYHSTLGVRVIKKKNPDARGRPLPSEEGTTSKGLRTSACKPTPEYGLDYLICAIFARQRTRSPRPSTVSVGAILNPNPEPQSTKSGDKPHVGADLRVTLHSDVPRPVIDSLGGVPREQKMLKGHLPRVMYHSILVYADKPEGHVQAA